MIRRHNSRIARQDVSRDMVWTAAGGRLTQYDESQTCDHCLPPDMQVPPVLPFLNQQELKDWQVGQPGHTENPVVQPHQRKLGPELHCVQRPSRPEVSLTPVLKDAHAIARMHLLLQRMA